MAAHLADQAQQACHVIEPGGLCLQYRDVHLFQAVNVCRPVAAHPDNDQIGLQRQDALEVDAAEIADTRLCLCRFRIIAGSIHAHHLRSGAHGKQQFGEMRRQRDDTLGRPAEFKRLSGIVVQTEGCGLRGRGYQQAQTNEAATDHRGARLPP